MKNIIVLYLISIYDKREFLTNFLNHYIKYESGKEHKLIICFKNFKKNDPIFSVNELNLVQHEKYLDNNQFNDFDWGSYKRVAEKNKNDVIFFMNCHSYPIVDNWLAHFVNNYENKTLLGASGSMESMVNTAFTGSHSKNKLKSYYYALSNFLRFPIFPNPHIRSNCFMISASDFIDLNFNKKYRYKKIGSWINESGRNGMTNFLKKKNFQIYVINSDGLSFDECEWHKSETYACNNQNKLIISDKFTRIFSNADYNTKKKIKKNIWG